MGESLGEIFTQWEELAVNLAKFLGEVRDSEHDQIYTIRI